MTGKAFINSLIGVLLKELTSLKNFDLKDNFFHLLTNSLLKYLSKSNQPTSLET